MQIESFDQTGKENQSLDFMQLVTSIEVNSFSVNVLATYLCEQFCYHGEE